MRTIHALRSLVLGALVLNGCAKDSEDTAANTKTGGDPSSAEDSNSESDGTTTGASATTGGTNPTTTANPTTANPTTGGEGTDSAATDAQTSGDSETCGFICDSTGGVNSNECDIWMQDCPATEKCMPWANDGGSSWNATKCTPLATDPAQPGDPCIAEGGAVSGVDNCGLGVICWFVDADSNGICVEMCTGSADAPMCTGDSTCSTSNDGVIAICLDACDPLAQSCPEGQICFSDGGNFICDFDASGEEGQYGDPCAYVNVCDYGLFCANPEAVPGCEAEGCCSPFCNLSEPNSCPGMDMGQECVAWYAEGDMPPPGQENLGACALP